MTIGDREKKQCEDRELTRSYKHQTKPAKLRNDSGILRCFLRRRRDLHIDAAPRA